MRYSRRYGTNCSTRGRMGALKDGLPMCSYFARLGTASTCCAVASSKRSFSQRSARRVCDPVRERKRYGGRTDDQANSCCWLSRNSRDFGASNNTRADSSTGRHDDTNCLWMRSIQDADCGALRRQDHHPPHPQSSPQGLLERSLERLLSAHAPLNLTRPIRSQSDAASPSADRQPRVDARQTIHSSRSWIPVSVQI
jgi:hypothetical protein